MTPLAAQIATPDFPGESLLVAAPGRSLTAAAVTNYELKRDGFGGAGQVPEASVVAISFRSPILFVEAILSLDGQVAGILLLAPTLPAASVKALMAEHGAVLVLSDRDDLDGSVPLESIVGRTGSGSKCQPLQTAWMLTTSGTTGMPKVVRHTLEGLTKSVRSARRGVERPRWGLLYDPSRFAGLQVVLQSLLGGGILIAPDLDAPWKARLAFLRDNHCSHLSATPSLWRKLLMSSEDTDWSFQQITLGGEVADEPVLRSLRHGFPKARITQIYASTEAGFGFSVNDGLPGFPVEFLQNPDRGPDIKIVDNIMWIRPPDAAANRPEAPHIVRDDEGFIRSGDRVEIKGGRVIILGRESSLINIGGVKVQAEDVERIVNDHPDVANCIVQSKPNSIVGAVITLVIVPNAKVGDLAGLRKQIKAWCKQHLPREAQPATISFSEQLAMGSSGKILRDGNQ